MSEPLTAQQVRAADLLGRNWSVKDVAAEVGVSEKTLGPERWAGRADFAAAVKESRDRVLDANPSARVVLEGALGATRKDGSPDWQVRVSAAKALLTSDPTPPGADPDAPPPTVVYISPDE